MPSVGDETIPMTFDEELRTEADRAVKKLGTTRSVLVRESVRTTAESEKSADAQGSQLMLR